MFWTAAAGLFCAILLLDAAPGRFDLLPRARAHPDSANRDCARQIAICEHLCRAFPRLDQSRLEERLSRHLGPARPALPEIAQTNDLVLDPKDIAESARWQPLRARPLAALGL